jgi:polysaccharide export outer membrane protein
MTRRDQMSRLFFRCWRLIQIRSCRGAAAIAVVLLAAPLPAKAEYHLDVGDVLDVSVFGVAELRAHTRVNMDGDISFPLLGEVHAVGLTASQLRDKVQNLLAEQVQQHHPSGPTLPLQRGGVNEVTVEITEYRPIYIQGDVAHSSEQAFRPGMTVRQAILLAGGYAAARGHSNATTSAPPNSQVESAGLWVDFAQETARIWRLESELADQSDGERPQMRSVPLATDLLSKIVDADADILRTDRANYNREVSQIRLAAKDTELQVDLLTDQIRKQKAELDTDTLDLSKLRQLSEKSLVTMDRISAQRHQVFLTTTQFLQSSSQLAELRKERGDLDLRLDKLTGDRHITLVRELQDANIKLALVRERLQAAGEKPVSADKRGQSAEDVPLTATVSIVRNENQASTTIDANEDSTLLPGDVVRVSLTVRSEPKIARE